MTANKNDNELPPLDDNDGSNKQGKELPPNSKFPPDSGEEEFQPNSRHSDSGDSSDGFTSFSGPTSQHKKTLGWHGLQQVNPKTTNDNNLSQPSF